MINTDILVIRVSADGTYKVRNSRPCEECTQIIKSKGIRYIYYSDKNGEIRREAANDFVSGYTNWLNENVRKLKFCSSHTEHLPAQEDVDHYTNHTRPEGSTLSSDPTAESTMASYA